MVQIEKRRRYGERGHNGSETESVRDKKKKMSCKSAHKMDWCWFHTGWLSTRGNEEQE